MAKTAMDEYGRSKTCSPSAYPPEDLIDVRDFSFRLPPGIKAKVIQTDDYSRITVVEFSVMINGFFRSIEVDIRDLDKARSDLYYFARLYRTDIWEQWHRNHFTHRAIEALKASRPPLTKKTPSSHSWKYTLLQNKIFDRRMNGAMVPFCILRERVKASNKPLLTINKGYVVDRRGYLNSSTT
ncbi:uncharacterized protein LOC106663717 [Cimex lectularius]|uniref:Uncharacterized protein n=1 Tax=Cimex lectularius TaxID=79782 RepID=A0A8I6RDT5_CIMLE|nr:uncharacterized protein LOC106663717 [Cimex lectularius]